VLCDRVLLAAFLGEKHNLTESDVSDVAKELRTELRGGLSDEEADAAAAGNLPMPTYAPTLSLVSGRGNIDPRNLPANAGGVLLNGLAEQVQLLQQSVASVARTLDQLRATAPQSGAQSTTQSTKPAERPAQAGGME
jgi:hypothetical protein